MNSTLNRFLHAVAASLAATVVLSQWTFRLDTAFRTSIVERNVSYMHFLADGRIFLSGWVKFPGDWMMATGRGGSCILSNGQQDTDFPNFPQTAGGGKIVPWMDGKFYVGTGLVRRLGPDGLVDPSFINNLNNNPYFSNHVNGDYHVYPDGRLLMSGRHILSDTVRGFVGHYNLIWFSNEGYLDTTRTHRRSNYPSGPCHTSYFAELPNEQFIYSGTCTEFEGKEVDRIFRVNADGTTDTTFRTGVYIGNARAYLPMDDGRVYVGGNFRRTVAPNDTLRLVRFMPDGSLDPNFSIPEFTAGQGLTTPDGAYVFGITAWKGGRLIITGHFLEVNGQSRKGICMIDSTGQLLDAFDGQGVGPFSYQSTTTAAVTSVVVNADSTELYICGRYVGYNDGTINDPTQRFVSRLLVEEDTSTTSVGEVAAPKPPVLRLYPNPANGLVNLSYHQPGNTGNAHLLLRDAQGRVVQRSAMRGTHGVHTWDVQGIAPGVYMVELRREGRLEEVQRLVVQP